MGISANRCGPSCALLRTSAAFCYYPPPFESLWRTRESKLFAQPVRSYCLPFQFRLATICSPAETFVYGSLDLLGYEVRFVVR
jgi:hypothetical protein